MLFRLASFDLKYLITACSPAVDKRGIKPALGMIACGISKDGWLTGLSTDGYRIHSVTIPCSMIKGEPESIILLPIVKVPPKSKWVFIEILENEVIYGFDCLDDKQSIKIDDSEFPDVIRYLPKDAPLFTIYVNPKFMLDAFKMFKDLETVKIEFYGEVSPIMVRWNEDYAFVLPKSQ